MEKNSRITRRVCLGEVHVREDEPGFQSRTIVGRAIVFDTKSAPLYEDEEDIVYEIISPEAVTLELLGQSDIKMTMFHERQLILARSNKGKGTLKYGVDDKGVSFEFEAPKTIDGDKALELVRRGDIAGCSFAFSTYYGDEDYVTCQISKDAYGKRETVYTVKRITGLYDFTLAADPAYPSTEVEAREFVPGKEKKTRVENREELKELRAAAQSRIIII